MSGSNLSPLFVFDANFFIALKEVKAIRPYNYLRQARDKLKVGFYVSGVVFNECPFIVGQDFQEFSKAVNIELTTDKDLDQVKVDLKKLGVKLMAQDPDLTLVALAKSLKKKDNDVYIVSDDFKLSENVEALQYNLKFYSLPAFLQFLGQNLEGDLRNYYKVIRKKVLKLNLDFMMSRSNIYAPQAKIAWLIEQAVDVAGESITLKRNVDDKEREKDELDGEKRLITICDEFIEDKPLSKEKLAQIKPYESALNRVKKNREKVKEAKAAIVKGDLKNGLKFLKSANDSLNQTMQLMGTKMAEKHYQIVEKILTSEISKLAFLRAFILISANKVPAALESLDQTAMFATMARISETALTINFLKALLYVYNSLYNKAIAQYKFIHQLADNYGDETLQYKANIGEAVTLFLIGQHEDAKNQIQNIKSRVGPKSLTHLMVALIDSGDYFLALGFPEIASNLYSESLECAIDAAQKYKFNFILNKMKKAYMSSALIGTEVRPSGDISSLIDGLHDLNDSDTFNELMTQLALFSNKLYEPFEYFTPTKKKITYYDLKDEFKDEFDCVKIQENPETGRTLLIAFKDELGLVAFDVQLDQNLEGVAENYSIKLKKTCQIRIEPPDIIKETLFLIRAVIEVENEERDIEIARQMPVFFKQLNV